MSNQIKWFMIISTSIFVGIMSITSPIVHLYFMKHVSPAAYAASGTIGTIIAAMMQSFMNSEKNRNKMRKVFALVLLIDSIGFFVISLMSMDNANIRFIGMAIMSAVTYVVWETILIDAINKSLSGAKLTDFQSLEKSFRLGASAVGGIIAIFAIDIMSLETAVWLQCGANAIYSICDYKSYIGMTGGIKT